MKWQAVIRIMWITLGIVVGCLSGIGVPTPSQARETGQDQVLKIALLPILDALPFYVAEAEGYFHGRDIKIQALPVSSGLNRDQLMQAGEIDGMLNEMTTTASFNREGIQVKILGVARRAYAHFPLFRIIASPDSGLKTPSDLAGVPIGISKNTIIEYVTDRLLQAKGLGRGQIVKQSVPVIPERYQLLMQGRIKAATLPDPLGISALTAGAVSIVDDSAYPSYSVSVLSFSLKAINDKNEAIRLFLGAWDRAAARINETPDAYRTLLLEKIRIPPNVQKDYPVPPYPRKGVPDKDQWDDVMNWMVGRGLLASPLPYRDSVSRAFLAPSR